MLPSDLTPAQLVGKTAIRPGQTWLRKSHLARMARLMQQGSFQWDFAHEDEPMVIQIDQSGPVISQGHHRFVAALIVGIPLPMPVELRYDFWEQDVPFAVTWNDVMWVE